MKNNYINFHLKKLEKEQELKKKLGGGKEGNTKYNKRKQQTKKYTEEINKAKDWFSADSNKIYILPSRKKMGKTEITKIMREK